ncbi:hypothetical protein RI129_006420 [Pyrocoelia pectoralis]|uniref:Uncharacterized protein n=1 Tax=Pyrocoelia pectoralis TaxID=417401 RepID=A0AAN7VB82_9COLE
MRVFERKVLRTIFGPMSENGETKTRTNHEISQMCRREDVVKFVKSQRISWLGHIMRVGEDMVKRPTDYSINCDRNPKTQITWIKEVRKDMAEMKIDGEEVERRKKFREKIGGFRSIQVQEIEKKKTGSKWTEERRNQHSERVLEEKKEGRKIIIRRYFTWSIVG